MKKLDFLKLAVIYAVLFIIGTMLYVLSFRTFIFAGISVFFYRGIAIILLWGVILSGIMVALKLIFFKKLITVRDILLLFCAFCCINVVIFTHLPVTADRSITVFMLGYMAGTEETAYTKAELEDIFIDKYVYEFGAFDKRLEEQIISGTIQETADGKYRITGSGKSLISIYDKVSDWYGIDKKLVHPAE
ncbi:MAG: hypothetical protein ACYCYM_14375 [Saccharofermentanales bacterium]